MSKRPSTFKGMLMEDRETLLNILDKLKNRFNKYCDFIGIENEGHKRMLIISFPILSFVYGEILYSGFIEDFLHFINYKFYFFFLLPLSIILNGFFVKVFNWINIRDKK